jgi:hypothetical protein
MKDAPEGREEMIPMVTSYTTSIAVGKLYQPINTIKSATTATPNMIRVNQLGRARWMVYFLTMARKPFGRGSNTCCSSGRPRFFANMRSVALVFAVIRVPSGYIPILWGQGQTVAGTEGQKEGWIREVGRGKASFRLQ